MQQGIKWNQNTATCMQDRKSGANVPRYFSDFIYAVPCAERSVEHKQQKSTCRVSILLFFFLFQTAMFL